MNPYRQVLIILFIPAAFLLAGGNFGPDQLSGNTPNSLIDTSGTVVRERFRPPENASRVDLKENSFAEYLRNLPLKPHGSRARYYDGRVKSSSGVYAAVIDKPIGNRDLHQCADAVMRLRAEYLYEKGRYDQIAFHFTNGFLFEFSKWRKGYRIEVNGNEVEWVKKAEKGHSQREFREYLRMLYSYAGTHSLEKELERIELDELRPGDVFIQGGFPGHAVIVVDMARDENGKVFFLLAQSYMPAQEIQVLKNPANGEKNPWYSLEDIGEELKTPEWTFQNDDLSRFPN